MAVNYEYNYAEIDPVDKMCISVFSTSAPQTETDITIAIPVNDQEYLFKYYINGNWYEDAEGTIPWTSSFI